MNRCEMCLNYVPDEDTGEYYCAAYFDEDEAEAFITHRLRECPYYDPNDEYSIVKKQN